ncbi:hypothetical protein FS774_20890 [Agrobacterium vitis]|nr:hypothetical protein [Agrobacterium vitis]
MPFVGKTSSRTQPDGPGIVPTELVSPFHDSLIALPPGMRYRTGDYLAVLPRNPQVDVDRALRRFGLAVDTEIVIGGRAGAVVLPSGYLVALSQVLADYVELRQPATRAQVTRLGAATRCPPDRAALERLSEEGAYAREVLAKRVSLLSLDYKPWPDAELGNYRGCAVVRCRSR